MVTAAQGGVHHGRFSALQRAEIAEIQVEFQERFGKSEFQCSSTSRNC